MPATQPPAKVLVSGATGYIAAWVVQNLLERGYAVRGTARSVSKGSFLKKLFAPYGDRFEVVVVEDIAQVSLTGASTRWSFIVCGAHMKSVSNSVMVIPCVRLYLLIDNFVHCRLGWSI